MWELMEAFPLAFMAVGSHLKHAVKSSVKVVKLQKCTDKSEKQ